MADTTTSIFSDIAQQGIAFGILIVIIIALITDRNRLLKDLKELSQLMMTTLKDNGDKYADVVTKNTEANILLREQIRDNKNHTSG